MCYRLIEQDVQEKEEMRKEKKRLQDQLRRIKKMEGQGKHSKVKKDKPKPETTLKVIWREAAHALCVVCEYPTLVIVVWCVCVCVHACVSMYSLCAPTSR